MPTNGSDNTTVNNNIQEMIENGMDKDHARNTALHMAIKSRKRGIQEATPKINQEQDVNNTIKPYVQKKNG